MVDLYGARRGVFVYRHAERLQIVLSECPRFRGGGSFAGGLSRRMASSRSLQSWSTRIPTRSISSLLQRSAAECRLH